MFEAARLTPVAQGYFRINYGCSSISRIVSAYRRGRRRLSVEPRHLNRPGSLQGGVVATLLDAACAYTGLRTAAEPPAAQAVTVMLTISYPAKANTDC